MAKKGQVSITFHWVYVLIAGAVILLFFVGIALRQKSVAEKELTADVVRIMESIFASAGVSEKTKNTIDASGLAEYTLYFDCAEGTSEFGIKGAEYRAQNAVDPLFAPAEIQTQQLLTWSLPFKFPFKVIDLLLITSPDISYPLFFLQNPVLEEFAEELSKTKNVEHFQTPVQYENTDPQRFFQVRIVSDGSLDLHSRNVPVKLRTLEDSRVSLVELIGNRVLYFQKAGSRWSAQGQSEILFLDSDPQAASFAALLSGTAEQYVCNQKKILRRLLLVSEVYQEKVEVLKDYYTSQGEPRGVCMTHLALNTEKNVELTLQQLKENTEACLLAEGCSDLVQAAKDLQELNQQLELSDCIALY